MCEIVQPDYQAPAANEPIFEGHFPGWSLWPGVYTVEGMGQACMLLAVLRRAVEGAAEQGKRLDEVVAALRNIDAGFHLRPGHNAAGAATAREAISSAASLRNSATAERCCWVRSSTRRAIDSTSPSKAPAGRRSREVATAGPRSGRYSANI